MLEWHSAIEIVEQKVIPDSWSLLAARQSITLELLLFPCQPVVQRLAYQDPEAGCKHHSQYVAGISYMRW